MVLSWLLGWGLELGRPSKGWRVFSRAGLGLCQVAVHVSPGMVLDPAAQRSILTLLMHTWWWTSGLCTLNMSQDPAQHATKTSPGRQSRNLLDFFIAMISMEDTNPCKMKDTAHQKVFWMRRSSLKAVVEFDVKVCPGWNILALPFSLLWVPLVLSDLPACRQDVPNLMSMYSFVCNYPSIHPSIFCVCLSYSGPAM